MVAAARKREILTAAVDQVHSPVTENGRPTAAKIRGEIRRIQARLALHKSGPDTFRTTTRRLANSLIHAVHYGNLLRVHAIIELEREAQATHTADFRQGVKVALRLAKADKRTDMLALLREVQSN